MQSYAFVVPRGPQFRLETQDKRNQKISAVKVQAAQFGRERARLSLWTPWTPKKLPAGVRGLGCEIRVSAGLRNLFSMINCGRWVIIDEVIVWRQLGVDCVVWSQNKSRGWFKGNKSWGILRHPGFVGMICWTGRHPNVVCFYDLSAAQQTEEATLWKLEPLAASEPKSLRTPPACRSMRKLHPEAPRSKCFLHSHGGLSASSAQTSEILEAPGRHVMGCALIFFDRMLFRFFYVSNHLWITTQQEDRKEGIHPRFILVYRWPSRLDKCLNNLGWNQVR